MEKFFEQGTLSEEELTYGLRIALAHQQIFPVFCCLPPTMGSGELWASSMISHLSPVDMPPFEFEMERHAILTQVVLHQFLSLK